MPDVLSPLIHANPDLALSIELHPRTYDLPIYDKSWLAFFPDLPPESLAAVIRLAALCERRFAEAGRPVEQYVVKRLAARLCRLDGYVEILFDLGLADEFLEALRTELELERGIVLDWGGRDEAVFEGRRGIVFGGGH